jgi:hypothetical protein
MCLICTGLEAVNDYLSLAERVFTKFIICIGDNIQSVPGRKVNILEGHSIGHSK